MQEINDFLHCTVYYTVQNTVYFVYYFKCSSVTYYLSRPKERKMFSHHSQQEDYSNCPLKISGGVCVCNLNLVSKSRPRSGITVKSTLNNPGQYSENCL